MRLEEIERFKAKNVSDSQRADARDQIVKRIRQERDQAWADHGRTDNRNRFESRDESLDHYESVQLSFIKPYPDFRFLYRRYPGELVDQVLAEKSHANHSR